MHEFAAAADHVSAITIIDFKYLFICMHAAAASGKDITVQTGAARLFLSAPFLTLQAVLESDLIPTEQYCNLI